MNIGVLILAAGRATRFGGDKRLTTLPDGRRMIDTVIANIQDSDLPLLVCLGGDDDDLAGRLTESGISCIQCARAGEGMGGTLAEGIAHISDQWNGVLVALADMPWITPATYKLVAANLAPVSICLPVYEDSLGHPVGFGRDFYRELMSLTGDAGGRRLLDKHPECIRKLQVDDPAIHRDVDRSSDIMAGTCKTC